MTGEIVSFSLSSMYFLFLHVTIAAATGCLQYKFLKEHDVSLENHVMKSVPDILPYACRSLCVHTTFCFSVNMKTKQGSNYVTCELNNSSRVADPQDVISEAGSEYHQMAVSALFCFVWKLSKLFYVFQNRFSLINGTVRSKWWQISAKLMIMTLFSFMQKNFKHQNHNI